MTSKVVQRLTGIRDKLIAHQNQHPGQANAQTIENVIGELTSAINDLSMTQDGANAFAIGSGDTGGGGGGSGGESSTAN